MMKKKIKFSLSLSIVALLGGCSEEQVQRDVYNSLEDCLADWQKIELCEADQSSENNSGTTAHAGSGSSLSGNLNTRPSNNSEWSEDNQTVKQTLNPDGATHSGNSIVLREQATRALQQEKDTVVWAVRLQVLQWVI